MYKQKEYDLIVLANHKPSLEALRFVEEISKGKGEFVQLKIWRVTNNYALKDLKRKFKFEDLPCFVVTTNIAKTRKQKDHYYKDEIEEICRGEFQKVIRENARRVTRETRARHNLGLRVSNAKHKIRSRDVFPAARETEKERERMSALCDAEEE